MYSPQLLDHFYNPRNRGRVAEGLSGRARYDRCGDRLEVSLRLDRGRVAEARFEAAGCGAAVAVGSAGTQLLVGRTTEQARNVTGFQLDAALGGVPPSKRHAIIMFLECVARALGPRTANP